jgi:hypothetical protein
MKKFALPFLLLPIVAAGLSSRRFMDDLDVADQLDVKISGPSSVYYKGDPVVNKTIKGPGKVERRGGEGA